MNRRLPVSVALAITLIAMTVTFSITMIVSMNIFNSAVSSVVKKQAMYDKISEIDNYVRDNFFWEIDEKLLNDRIGRGYVDGTGDKFSAYFSEKEYTEIQRFASGEIVGLGIEVDYDQLSGQFNILRVYEGSPAEKAQVEAGGSIISVDGIDVTSLNSLRALNSLLQGEPETIAKLTCLYGAKEEKKFEIQREHYRAPTVEKITVLDKYAYIRISSFTNETAVEFDHLVQQAQSEGAKGLVFDLRDNNGGLAGGVYESAYKMIDLLCPRGTVAKSESKSGVSRLLATSDESYVDLPMVVLVNEKTAAAAELFAVSIRDLSGGKVVGVKTLGHGTLQSTPYRLSDGSALSITNAKLITGKGESYNEIGVIPDIEVFAKNITRTNLLNPDYQNDNQIQRAVEVVRSMAKEKGLDDGKMPEAVQGSQEPEFAPMSDVSVTSGDSQQASGSTAEMQESSSTSVSSDVSESSSVSSQASSASSSSSGRNRGN